MEGKGPQPADCTLTVGDDDFVGNISFINFLFLKTIVIRNDDWKSQLSELVHARKIEGSKICKNKVLTNPLQIKGNMGLAMKLNKLQSAKSNL